MYVCTSLSRVLLLLYFYSVYIIMTCLCVYVYAFTYAYVYIYVYVYVSDEEVGDILRGIHTYYCRQRESLLQGLVNAILTKGSPNEPNATGSANGGARGGSDLIEHARVLVPQMLRVCVDEYQLFCMFFGGGSSVVAATTASEGDESGPISEHTTSTTDVREMTAGVYGGLEVFHETMSSLFRVLYDHLRPALVKLDSLEYICEAVRVLQEVSGPPSLHSCPYSPTRNSH